MPRTYDPRRTEARRLMRCALAHWTEPDLVGMRCDQAPRSSVQNLTAAKQALESFLLYTEREQLPANRFGMTLAGLRRMTNALQAPELKEHIWTWDIQKRRNRASVKA